MHTVSMQLPIHRHPIVNEKDVTKTPSALSGSNLNMKITDIIVIIALNSIHSNKHDLLSLVSVGVGKEISD